MRNQDTGVTRTSTTETDGRYRFLALSPGRYHLSAVLSGFASKDVGDVTLTIGLSDLTGGPSGLTGVPHFAIGSYTFADPRANYYLVWGVVLVVFVVCRAGVVAGPDLEEELKDMVAKDMGKPLRPKAIHFVPDLPKTRNAKILRRVVKAVYLGLPPGDLTALENPQSLEAIGAARGNVPPSQTRT